MREGQPLHPVSRTHLDILTDDVGVMQHAIGPRPDPAHGYCTDDVARSLQVDLLHQRELGWHAVEDSAWRSLRFLQEAFDETAGRFRNFRRTDGVWIDAVGSEDSHGRAMLALGETIATAPDARMSDAAGSLFSRGLPGALGLHSLRAQSSVLLGCEAALRRAPSEPAELTVGLLATRLTTMFASRPWPDWRWPEPRLTYENALPARALIVAGRYLESPPMTDTGLEVLDWLIVEQTATAGCLSPVGNTWWPRAGEKPQFDQQPIEATALLLAAESAYRATKDGKYRTAMEQAYGWFLGANDLRIPIAVPEDGASYDALTPRGVNANQGAESTLMWLIASEHIRAMRAERSPRPAATGPLLAGASR